MSYGIIKTRACYPVCTGAGIQSRICTLPQRCALLQEHKKAVENQIEEMPRYLQKLTHKIAYCTEQYQKVALTGPPTV
jgi:hypothetical protein